jgi:predicted permease
MRLLTTIRSLARQPGLTVPAVLTLALGIGAMTALFAYLAAIVWPRLAIRQAGRLVWIYSGTAEQTRQQSPFPDYLEIRRRPAVAELAAYSPFGSSVGLAEQTTYAWGQYVNGDYFSFLDAQPTVGRLLGPADDRPEAPLVAVVSYPFWKGALGGDGQAVGRTLRLNGKVVTVVGVAPEGFEGLGLPAAIYVPLAQADQISWPPRIGKLETRWVNLAGRLAPGISRAGAQAAMDQLARALDETAPLPGGKRRISLIPAGDYDVGAVGEGGDPYLSSAKILLAASGLFLLLGCASIANLLLARATARQREWAIRAALGAGRLRLAGGILLESVLLCLAGAAAGLPFAAALARRIDAYAVTAPPGFGNWGEGVTFVRLDARAVAFAFGIAMACALLGGLGPALRMLRRDLLAPLKSDAAGGGTAAGTLQARSFLAVAQVALSVVLLLDGGLLVRSLQSAQEFDTGLAPDRLLLAATYLPRSAGGDKGTAALSARLLEEVRAVPGVTAVTLALVPPLSGITRVLQAAPHEKPEQRSETAYDLVGADYFATVGIPIVQGRALDRRDSLSAAPAVVVNSLLARKLWGTTNVVGRRIEMADPPRLGEPGPVFEVVGVTADVRCVSPVEPPRPMLYFSHEQRSAARMTVVARTAGPPLAVVGGLRRSLRAVHPDLSIIEMMTGREELARVLVLPRMYAEVAGLFGLLGLAVAVVGLFGLLSYTASLRGREMGIRMAVGARPWDVRRLVVRQGMVLVAAGVVLGIAAALFSTRLLAGLLFGVGTTDPLTFLLVPAVLALVALVACDIPARRAAGLDPAVVLRNL